MFSPAVDIVVEKDNVIVKADLPGLTKDDVSVTLQDNYLTIRGEKKHETEQKEANYFLSERVYGSFTRTIELPLAVDAKKIEARFKDGVLHVTLPKTEEAKPEADRSEGQLTVDGYYTLGLGPFTGSAFALSGVGRNNAATSCCTCASWSNRR